MCVHSYLHALLCRCTMSIVNCKREDQDSSAEVTKIPGPYEYEGGAIESDTVYFQYIQSQFEELK